MPIITRTQKLTPTRNDTPYKPNLKSQGRFEWMLNTEIKKLKEKDNGKTHRR